MSTNKAYATLKIISTTLRAQDITDALQIIPTASRNQWDFLRRNAGGREFYAPDTLWLLRSSQSQDTDLQEHMSELIDLLLAKAEGLKKLENHCKLHLSCFYKPSSGKITSLFEHDFIQKIAQLPIDLWIDIH